MIVWAVAAAYMGLAERRKQELHTVSERNPEKAAVPIVVHREAAGVAVPFVVHKEAAEVVRVVHLEAAEVAVPNLVVAAGLDHKTWIISSCQICNRF